MMIGVWSRVADGGGVFCETRTGWSGHRPHPTPTPPITAHRATASAPGTTYYCTDNALLLSSFIYLLKRLYVGSIGITKVYVLK